MYFEFRILLESSKQILPKHTSHLKRTGKKSYFFKVKKHSFQASNFLITVSGHEVVVMQWIDQDLTFRCDESGEFVGEHMMLEHSFMLVCWHLVDLCLANLLETHDFM